MADIFADTAGWGHLIDASQGHHQLAAAIYHDARRQGRKFVTTNYVIGELVALLTSPLRLPRPTMISLINGLKSSAHVEIVHVDATLDSDAWGLLTSRQDKLWSLVDCSSFVVMKQLGLTQVLTTDHHFEQAGFVRLLR